MTLGEYFDRWAEHKTRIGRRNVARERNQLQIHVEPTLGRRRPADVTPADVLDLCWDRYERGKLSAKGIKNLKGILSSAFERAVFERLCEYNPCKQVPRDELPKAGHNPWPKYERADVIKLLSDERIGDDNRTLYALSFFLALRIGEACGLRFGDWDRTTKPLGRVTVDSQYQDQPLKGARDDYRAERAVPVHPELARILAAWRLGGFQSVYGRPPRKDDFMVPRRRSPHQARSQSQAGKALVRDEIRTGIEHKPGRATHGFRKAFASLACDDDAGGMADGEVIKALTHTGKSRDVFDRYRQWSWETFCKAVRCVELELPATGHVISIEERRSS